MREDRRHPPTRGVPAGGVGPLIDRSLARLRRRTGVPLAFAGQIQERVLTLRSFDGDVVGPLRGALLDAGQGLGGRVLVERRPLALRDYVRTPSITHVYDRIIRAEGLRSMAAAPVVVGRREVAVLYAALRDPMQELGLLVEAVVDEARSLEQSLAVSDALGRMHPDTGDRGQSPVQTAMIHRELRELSKEIADEDVRHRLLEIAERLDGTPVPSDSTVALTNREHDVLVLLSNGLSNAAIAEGLGIGVYTVKAHVKSIMRKLHASTRYEAVIQAARLNLLS